MISDFTLFEQTLSEYNEKNINQKQQDKQIKYDNCDHDNTINESGIITCIDCGIELQKDILHEKEWRYYGASDSKRSSDPNRVQMRKSEDRSIYKDVASMGFSETIVSKANSIYTIVTKGKIYRASTRKAIIFACIYHAYNISGNPQDHDKLTSLFSISHKSSMKGLKHVNLHAPKNSIIHTTYITPGNMVSHIMRRFRANEDQIHEVEQLYKQIENKSSKLNRSRPQSVACGLTYYWICKNKINLSLDEFRSKVSLSPLTIQEIAKEIAKVLGTPEIV
jgi:transcription initiation factor TFIIIB Brf1 subunit/transcription initiation factor TFIIB